ncbi:universal stress protein [Streptomyces chromofuscus]|uniref:Universal stress protein n=1 Tax=Streptomyces chromofuscus TaxID=42881 RepID=A0A7M2TF90_STRCW|nr:universal stress protein [Streptomyces chromofuscus]
MLTDRLDDLTVADTAARLAASRGEPLLLVAVLPPSPSPAPDAGAEGPAVLGRVLPRLVRYRTGYIPAVYRRPGAQGSRLGAATDLLRLAAMHHSPLVVASRCGPPGLDACTLIEAAAIRGRPFIHAVPPVPWTRLAAPCPPT